MDEETKIDELLLIDKINKEIKQPFKKEINTLNLNLYIKIAEFVNFKLDELGASNNTIFFIEHKLPKEYSENGKEEIFSFIKLKISKINVFQNTQREFEIKFNGVLEYMQRSGYKEIIKLTNEPFKLKTFENLYNDKEFLDKIDTVLKNAITQISDLLKRKGVNI